MCFYWRKVQSRRFQNTICIYHHWYLNKLSKMGSICMKSRCYFTRFAWICFGFFFLPFWASMYCTHKKKDIHILCELNMWQREQIRTVLLGWVFIWKVVVCQVKCIRICFWTSNINDITVVQLKQVRTQRCVQPSVEKCVCCRDMFEMLEMQKTMPWACSSGGSRRHWLAVCVCLVKRPINDGFAQELHASKLG